MFPLFDPKQKSRKKKCVIYKKNDGSDKELNLKVHQKFILFRYFNDQIPESFSPLAPAIFSNKEMREVYKCVLYSYLSYKDRSIINFPPEIKIEFEKFDSDVGKIPFFIAFDSTINAIVLSCRGSSCMDDFITDSLGNGVTYNGGKFHEGVFSTASYVFLTCQTKLIELNEYYNTESNIENDESSYSYDQEGYYYSDYYSEEESYYEEEDTATDNDNDNQFLINKFIPYHMSHRNNKLMISHNKSTSEPNFHSYHKSKADSHQINNSIEKLNKNRRSSSASDALPHKKSSNGNLSGSSNNEDLDSNGNHRRSSSVQNENLYLNESQNDTGHNSNLRLNSDEKPHENDNDDQILDLQKNHHHKSMPNIKSKNKNDHSHSNKKQKSGEKLDDNSNKEISKEEKHKSSGSSSLKHEAEHYVHSESKEKETAKEEKHKSRRSSSLTHETEYHDHNATKEKEAAKEEKHKKRRSSSLTHENSHPHHKSLSNLDSKHKVRFNDDDESIKKTQIQSIIIINERKSAQQ